MFSFFVFDLVLYVSGILNSQEKKTLILLGIKLIIQNSDKTKIRHCMIKKFQPMVRLPAAFLFGAVFYLYFVALFNKGVADYDLWGYLSFGRVFWEERFFPYRDIFAYTPTKEIWVYHEWLTGVVFYWLLKNLGPAALQLLNYVLAVMTILTVYLTARKRGGSLFFTLIVMIPAMLIVSFGYVPVRAQVFTFFFFALTLYLLETAKKERRSVFLRWLPLIQMIWCNLHGGFVAGLGLIFLYAVGESLQDRKIAFSYFKWGFFSLIATLVNPYGIQYWFYTLHAVLMSRPEITEWYSVWHALKSQVYVFPATLFLLTILATCAVWGLYRKKDITEMLVVFVLIYLGLVHVRHTVLFGLAAGAYLPLWLERGTAASSRPFGRMSAAAFAVFCVLAYFFFYPPGRLNFFPTFKFYVSSDLYPTQALAWMQAKNVKGNILPHFDWGEYLIWRYYPETRVAVDGRYETVYRQDVLREYFDFSFGRARWDVFLKKYPHDYILLKAGTKTQDLMSRETEWQVVYSDRTSVIFARQGKKAAVRR
jgi:hypothetical protein